MTTRITADVAGVRTTLSVSLLGVMSLVLSLMASPGRACAQVAPPGEVFSVSYFDIGATSGIGDNTVRMINPTRATGDLCAMIYVFDDDQEMEECCGCPLSPNDLLTLSVKNNLTNNRFSNSNAHFDDGVIEVVSALPNSPTSSCSSAAGCVGGCDPTNIYQPTPMLNAWITHVDGVSSVTGVSVAEFANGVYDQVEKNELINLCQFIVGDGSGAGVCSCGQPT